MPMYVCVCQFMFGLHVLQETRRKWFGRATSSMQSMLTGSKVGTKKRSDKAVLTDLEPSEGLKAEGESV